MAADLHLPWGWGFLRGIVGCMGVLALWACSHKPPVAQVAAAGRMPLGTARPQLTEAQALQYTVTNYLAQAGQLTGSQGQGLVADGWAPAALGDASAFESHFVVAADGSGSHRTVQAAVDAVPARSATDRRYYIEVRPGTYRETVCVLGKAPVTLYGASPDAHAVAIVGSNYNGKAKTPHAVSANACHPHLAGATYGTSGSATFAVYSDAFHAKNVSFVNDAMQGVVHGMGYPPGASGASGAQAVALMTQGDQLVFENVRVIGHQDSLYVKTATLGTVARAYFRDSHIQGDVDFVFGRGVLVLDRCTLHFTSARLPLGSAPSMLAPSTAKHSPYGILIHASRFTADAQTPLRSVYLGRAWDEGIPSGAHTSQSAINGQLVVRDSHLGAHVHHPAPWGASTSARPFSSAGNRFAEFNNTPMHLFASTDP